MKKGSRGRRRIDTVVGNNGCLIWVRPRLKDRIRERGEGVRETKKTVEKGKGLSPEKTPDRKYARGAKGNGTATGRPFIGKKRRRQFRGKQSGVGEGWHSKAARKGDSTS